MGSLRMPADVANQSEDLIWNSVANMDTDDWEKMIKHPIVQPYFCSFTSTEKRENGNYFHYFGQLKFQIIF